MTAALAHRDHSLVLAGPVGSLDAYMQAVSGIPVLSREEEQALSLRFRDSDDLEAARSLVLSNLRFVVHVAKGYLGYGLPLADLIQEGNIGLMKAVKRFDPEVGVRLVSFAVHWIRAEIHEYVLRNWRLVKVATTKAQRKLFFNLRKARKHLGWLSEDERHAVAKDLGVSKHEVVEMEKRLSSRDMSFDFRAGDEDDGSFYAPAAYLQSEEADPAQSLEDSDFQQNSHERLSAGLATLDARSRDIINRRWLSDDKNYAADAGRRVRHFRGADSPDREQCYCQAERPDGRLILHAVQNF